MEKTILNEISSVISGSHKNYNYAAIDFDNTSMIKIVVSRNNELTSSAKKNNWIILQN